MPSAGFGGSIPSERSSGLGAALCWARPGTDRPRQCEAPSWGCGRTTGPEDAVTPSLTFPAAPPHANARAPWRGGGGGGGGGGLQAGGGAASRVCQMMRAPANRRRRSPVRYLRRRRGRGHGATKDRPARKNRPGLDFSTRPAPRRAARGGVAGEEACRCQHTRPGPCALSSRAVEGRSRRALISCRGKKGERGAACWLAGTGPRAEKAARGHVHAWERGR